MKKLRIIQHLLVLSFMVAMLAACGRDCDGNGQLTPIGTVGFDNAVVHGRAYLIVNSDGSMEAYDETAYYNKKLNMLLALVIPSAIAQSASVPITYTNSASITYSISTAGLLPNPTQDASNILDLGSLSLSTLDDNKLKVCGTGGTTKCTKAFIRFYTTGTMAGFTNASDGYGVPVTSGSQTIGLGVANAIKVQEITIGSTKNRIVLADFPSPTYPLKADMSNAGAGTYTMTLVMEYALSL